MQRRWCQLCVALLCLLMVFAAPATVHAEELGTEPDQTLATAAATEVADGWVQDESGNWSYYVDGSAVTNQVLEIDGSYYGFDANGIMYKDTAFGLYSSEAGTYLYYRAKVDGKLYADAWYQDGDSWYYYKANGVRATQEVTEIGGSYYAFSSGGVMYDNTSTDLYIEDNDGTYRWCYFRAKEGGKLYVNEWYEDSWGDRYYYGERGIAPEGLTTVDGVTYYFSNSGYMYANSRIQVDGVYYYADSTGVVHELKNNQWTYADGYYFYVQDNVLCTSGVHLINGSYYGFDYDGRMYNNTTFSVNSYDEDGYFEGYFYYRAKEGGKLYVNEWYKDSWGNWYYYGEGGRAASGVTTVGSNTYYFYDAGQMAANTVISDGTNCYVAGENGALTTLPNNRWTKIDGYYYYVQDGVICQDNIYLINGSYYAFDYNGRMYDNVSTDLYIEDNDGNYRWCYFRAKEGGRLYVNEWYEDSWGDRYYYGERGIAYRGLATVNGVTYYFGYDGYICTNVWNKVDGVYYYADSTGVVYELKNDQWTYADGYYFYVQDNVLCTSGVYLINGSYYGFNYNGQMYNNTTFSVNSYDEDGYYEGYFYYCAREGGKLYVNEWYEDSYGNWYYYGEGGRAASGVTTINGRTYFFESNGCMATNSVVQGDGVCYYVDEDGYLTVMPEGWSYINDYYYYVGNGTLYQRNIYLINGNYYAFRSNGRMYRNGSYGFSYYDEDGDYNYVYIRAKEDGKLYVNEWYEDAWGDRYYYGEGGKAASGVVTVDGVQYYFYENGLMAVDAAVMIDGVPYKIDENGAMSELANNQWTTAGGEWYYVMDGELCSDGIYKIGNSYYGFDYSGHMYNNESFYLEYYDEDDNWYYGYFRAKSGGALCVNEWYKTSDGYWYYYGADGRAPIGLNTIGSSTYYFYYDGRMAADAAVSVDGVAYKADSNGALTVLPNNQWAYMDGKYYYVKDNSLLTNGIYQIGGAYYGFDYYGAMYANTAFEMSVYNEEYDYYEWFYFRAAANGALYVNSWYKSGTDWYYYGEGGKALRNLQTIGGKTYFFNYEGRMVVNQLVYSNDDCYYVDADGIAHKLNNNAWTKIGDDYFYMIDGTVCQGGVYQIGGAYYGFAWNGVMYADTAFSVYKYDESTGSSRYCYYYAGSNGALYTNKWYQDGVGDWRYYGADGAAVTGVQTINGATYVFSSDGWAYKNRLVAVDGKIYKVGSNNVATLCADGWVQHPANGEWCYVLNGELVEGQMLKINGTYYGFDWSGYLGSDEILEIYDGEDYKYIIVDGDGKVITKQGWYTRVGQYYYVNADYTLYQGILTVGGSKYYMNPAMAYSTIVSVYNSDSETSEVYIAGTSGALQTVTSDGFYTTGGGAYRYIRNGKIVCSEWVSVGSDWYYLTEDGYRADYGRYQIDGTYYLFDTDGTMYTNGWLRIDNSMYYANSDGTAATGVQTIDGKQYLFSNTGYLYKNDVINYNSVSYAIDENGVILATSANASEGWNYLDGAYYYVEDGYFVWAESITDAAGNMYYIDYYGKMVVNSFYNSRYYGANGAAKSGWFKIGSAWYYADPNNSNYLLSGLTTIDGKQYYFNSGRMFVGQRWFNGKYYNFGSDGALISVSDWPNGWSYANGTAYYYKNGEAYTGWVGNYYINAGVMQRFSIVGTDGAYYYVGGDGAYVKNQFCSYYGYEAHYAKSNGVLAQNEWLQIDGDWYYFDGISKLYGGVYSVDGQLCMFDENGVYQGVYTANGKADGWVKIGSDWYYSNAGKYITASVRYIDGAWYYFNSTGKMMTNRLAYSGGALYYYGSNGKRVDYTGWKQIDGDWGYFQADHSLKEGWLKDNGKWYYMYGIGYATGYVSIDDVLYYFDNNGVMTKTISKQNGWYKTEDGQWYYFENGSLVGDGYDCYRVIDGKEYYFWGGRMATNTVVYTRNGYRYVGSDGVIVTKSGWYKFEDTYVYVMSDGYLATGVQKINGKIYYFDGYMWIN